MLRCKSCNREMNLENIVMETVKSPRDNTLIDNVVLYSKDCMENGCQNHQHIMIEEDFDTLPDEGMTLKELIIREKLAYETDYETDYDDKIAELENEILEYKAVCKVKDYRCMRMENQARCIEDALTLMADYDGYNTVEGLKKLVDQTVELLQTSEPFEFHTEKEWHTIEELKAENNIYKSIIPGIAKGVAILWDSVDNGMHDSRSLVGDVSLSMQEILMEIGIDARGVETLEKKE